MTTRPTAASTTSATPRTVGDTRGAAHPAVKLLAVLLVAGCLRPALTSVGPVLDLIGADTGLGTTALGALGALPLLAFAALSPFVHGPGSRFGAERVVLWAMVALAAGIAVRSLPGNAWLWCGAAVAGASIAVGNVLVPSIVKRDHPGAVSRVTGVYTSVMTGFAALASGVAVPIAAATGNGWRWSLAVWAVPALLAAGVWALRMRGTRSRAAAAGTAAPTVSAVREKPVWRSAVAWQVTFFMGLQSTTFYLLVNWLPTMETARGVPASTAGWYLFLFQAVGIVSGLAVTAVMGARSDQRATGVLVSVPMVAAMAGMLWAPGWSPVWVVLAGISSGSTIVVALALIGLRTRTFAHTAKLSGMAQSVGYLLAAAGPIAAGRLADGTGSWTPVIVLIAGLALAQTYVVLWAGRDRYTHPEPANA
ncbi:CynX/NimT family MFS transporter [Microtetraspora fusca]|uniref:CynX/NimT family MFS transporter n=1 Tax=Microtetraspora fusca TaxID=1997 RepID=UPI0009FEC26E|nr:MFS transporter [Microtetraspora fusca]